MGGGGRSNAPPPAGGGKSSGPAGRGLSRYMWFVALINRHLIQDSRKSKTHRE